MANEQGTAGLVAEARAAINSVIAAGGNPEQRHARIVTAARLVPRLADALEAATAPAPAVESVMGMVDDFADAQAELRYWGARDEQEHLATANRDRAAVDAAITDLARERDAAVNALAAERARADAATARAGMLREALEAATEPMYYAAYGGSACAWCPADARADGTVPHTDDCAWPKICAALAADAGDAAPADALGGDGEGA